MMKTIDELWYGNISPFEQCTRGDKRLKELLKLVARNREELDGTLTDKQKETLEKLKDKGYSPKSAEVRFVVAWKGEEDTEETPIILADMYFEKIVT